LQKLTFNPLCFFKLYKGKAKEKHPTYQAFNGGITKKTNAALNKLKDKIRK
jgi:hypothetical protein